MSDQSSRVKREVKTVSVMISLYCKKHHHQGRSCVDCAELTGYALARLKACPFQEGKTVCSKCPVHCYKTEMREKIRVIMRFSGPRMIYRHPPMAIMHLLDKRRDEPLRFPEKS